MSAQQKTPWLRNAEKVFVAFLRASLSLVGLSQAHIGGMTRCCRRSDVFLLFALASTLQSKVVYVIILLTVAHDVLSPMVAAADMATTAHSNDAVPATFTSHDIPHGLLVAHL